MSTTNIWGFSIDNSLLSPQEESFLASLPEERPDVQWVWNTMDTIWDELQLNNKAPLHKQQASVASFYSHPIWLVNGIFTATDQESQQHRKAIAQFISTLGNASVADYGGGFAELATNISQYAPQTIVDVIEPYPSKIGLSRINENPALSIHSELQQQYDVVIAQDVLEHVDDPIELTAKLVDACKIDGYLIFANCFKPCIKCHLPKTFHLNASFKHIVKPFGLKFLHALPEAEHIQVFQKISEEQEIRRVKSLERLSRLLHPGLMIAKKIKRLVK
jgi:2-polyprenyl-6-hydroxyphenyl methylase/3-demethylubiquinone-9 3-methyltransferase